MKTFMNRVERIYMDCHALLLQEKIPISNNVKEIKINTRAKKRLGCCKQVEKTLLGKWSYIIEVSYRMKDASDIELTEVLLHELLHTCPGCMNHGVKWKGYVKQINDKYGYKITTTVKRKLPGEESEQTKVMDYKYVIICKKCGAKAYRKKKSKLVENVNNYRCGKCGGKLKISAYTPHLVDEK